MKIRDLDLETSPVNVEHQALGLPPIEEAVSHADDHPVLKIIARLALAMLIGAVLYMATRLFHATGSVNGAVGMIIDTLQSPAFQAALLVGILAQTIDGALGMAYGITSSTFLLASGISPAVATASVHIAEVFTTGVSGLSHVKLKNVNYKLFIRLLVPGILGAVTGAYFVSTIDGKALKPYIAIYLLLMGIYLITKVFRKYVATHKEPKHVAKLAVAGGFMDAVGGGGWGPIVTTTLVGSGHDPRTTIGSVNFAEFFLTFGAAIAFSLLVEDGPWPVVAGLVIGGAFAAPFAAVLTRKFHAKTLLAMVGVLISLVSLYNLYKAFLA